MRKQSTVDNAISMFLGTAINIIISVLTTPIITRVVNPSDYGQWSLFTSYSNIMMAFVMVGLDQAFVRFYYKKDTLDYKRYIIHTVIKIPVALWAVVSIFGLFIYKNINLFEYNTLEVYLLLLFNILVLVLNRIGLLVLRMEQKGSQYSLLIVLNKVMYLLILILLVTATDLKDFLKLSLATVLSQLLVTVISIFMEKSKWGLKYSKNHPEASLKKLIIYGLPFIYSIIAGDIFNFADKWVIKGLKDYSDVGIYSAAANIVAITSIIQSTFGLLWAPMAMKQYEKDPEDKRLYIKANGCITIAMFMMGAGVICFKDIIVLLLGNKYRFAATVVPFLIFNPIMTTISETTSYGLNFKNKTWYHMIITTIAAVTNIVLNLLLVPRYSSEGAALATAISYTLFFVLRTFFSNRCYKVNFPLVRFFIVTGAFFAYATVNTFLNVTIVINVLLLVAFTVLILMLYSKYFKLLFDIGVAEVKKHLKLDKKKG